MRFCLPSGSKFTRSFLPTTPIAAVRDYVDIHIIDNSIGIKNYDLRITYPKMTLTSPSTLQESGVTTGTVVMIIDLDA